MCCIQSCYHLRVTNKFECKHAKVEKTIIFMLISPLKLFRVKVSNLRNNKFWAILGVELYLWTIKASNSQLLGSAKVNSHVSKVKLRNKSIMFSLAIEHTWRLACVIGQKPKKTFTHYSIQWNWLDWIYFLWLIDIRIVYICGKTPSNMDG